MSQIDTQTDKRTGRDRRRGNRRVTDESVVETELELEQKKWYHRRRMAYWALRGVGAIIFFVGTGSAVSETFAERMVPLVEFFIWAVLALVSIVGFYYGTSTWADIKNIGKR